MAETSTSRNTVRKRWVRSGLVSWPVLLNFLSSLPLLQLHSGHLPVFRPHRVGAKQRRYFRAAYLGMTSDISTTLKPIQMTPMRLPTRLPTMHYDGHSVFDIGPTAFNLKLHPLSLSENLQTASVPVAEDDRMGRTRVAYECSPRYVGRSVSQLPASYRSVQCAY
jgi:hypothetical protein